VFVCVLQIFSLKMGAECIQCFPFVMQNNFKHVKYAYFQSVLFVRFPINVIGAMT